MVRALRPEQMRWVVRHAFAYRQIGFQGLLLFLYSVRADVSVCTVLWVARGYFGLHKQLASRMFLLLFLFFDG